MQTKSILKKILFLVAVILLWQMVFYFTTSVFNIWKPYMFPNPLGVIETFWSLLNNGSLFIAVGVSMRRVFTGYLLSVFLGWILGLVLYKFRFLDDMLRPILLGLQMLPSICWLPFAILWFGLTETAILFVIIIGSTFSVTLAVNAGMKNVNPLYIKAALTMGAKRWQLFGSVIIPGSLPQILSGLKQGWSFSWRALMNGEMLSATIGLGQILMLGRDLADINQVMCVMVVIIVLGMVIDKLLFGFLEKKLHRDWGLEPEVKA